MPAPKPDDYWREICAPLLRQRRRGLPKDDVTQKKISLYIQTETKKGVGLANVGHWLRGKREPYISQFIALCYKLDIDPGTVIGSVAKRPTTPATEAPSRKVISGSGHDIDSLGKTGRSGKALKRRKEYK